MIEQLTLDGGAVPYAYAAAPRKMKLTGLQRDILDLARVQGQIRSVEAGTLVHSHRGRCSRVVPTRKGALACCRYGTIDGSMACRRLMRRGLLYRDESGKRPIWRPA